MSIVFSGCSLWRSNENQAITFAPQPKSEYPFQAREPEVFQADLVIRTGEIERRIFIARSGAKRRIEYDVGSENHRGVLIADNEYLLFFKRKVYTERPLSADATSLFEPVTAHLLNARDYADFEEVERQGSVVEFRARVNESAVSEVLIFFDETIGLPMRQEFYSIDGDQRSLQYSVELQGFRTDVDQALFRLPSDFRRVAKNPL